MNRKFLIGVILIVVSTIVGLPAAGLGGLLAAHYGKVAVKIGVGIYVISWVLLGLGFVLAGPEGLKYSKEWLAQKFRKSPPD